MHLICRDKRWRQRKIQTLLFLLLIVLIYFFMQFFTLSKLEDKKIQDHYLVQDPFKELEVANDLKAESTDSNSADSRHRPKRKLPRGVHHADGARYAADEQGMFSCLISKIKIPISQVNDDYCDCPDSSDEPGTSACAGGRFYCQIQLPANDAQFVFSSRVNDGICDCCDGSDEWQGRTVPGFMQLLGKRGAVFHAPCRNQCGDVYKLLKETERIRRQGLLLQKEYISAAKQLSPRDRQKFGPLGIFYLLSQQCYDHSALEYSYSVCPFQWVKQGRGPRPSTLLGQQGVWLQQKPGDYLLKMGGGLASLCPDGLPRQALIRFLCGLADKVIDVIEDQKCRYTVRFSTPAAC